MNVIKTLYSAAILAALVSAPLAKSTAQSKKTDAKSVVAKPSLAQLKNKVLKNPDDINNIQDYYDAFLDANPGHEKQLKLQMQNWVKQFPSNPLFPVYLKRATKLAARTTDKNALDRLKRAVEASPDSMSSHVAYIEAIGPDGPEVASRYEELMKAFPENANVPYALGKAYIEKESPKARPYLLKAVEINPQFARAWYYLWVDDLRWGRFDEGWEYLKKAIAADPTNPEYQYRYALSFMGLDQGKFSDLSIKVAKDFPTTEYAVRALGYLASSSATAEERIKSYQLLHENFPAEKGAPYMTSYFDVLLSTDPEKARALAVEMKDVKDAEGDNWTDLVTQADLFIQAKKLLDQRKPLEGLAVLNKIKLSKYSQFGRESLLFLKAEATDQTGNHSSAYDQLMKVFVKDPSPALQMALDGYGAKLGKNQDAVKADIYQNLLSKAKPATPFTLKKYIGEGNASLSDYKGKVLLLTYWFPGCGPCRAEMPFFENVVKQYQKGELAYVGINIVAEQDQYVIPFHNSSGFSFTPLAEVKGRDKGNLENYGAAPTNFLIDKNGRIVFSDFMIGAENETHLKMMIDLLLNAPNEFTQGK
ncbi:Thiol-disulfide isomerase and thioredoxin [Pedobacter sp. BAL39]|uniref:redoxin family protein n=1 Tax=Pedobacter sp. BAL39 TaxID=391596 RepID=UPI0001559B14|nr:redoxin family protein [Pedobacter sp. BAL39]EDM36275.1 Thiol-disulfide isomerase and thioredoxin [Pedobacter sp. BAL39]